MFVQNAGLARGRTEATMGASSCWYASSMYCGSPTNSTSFASIIITMSPGEVLDTMKSRKATSFICAS